MSALIQWTSPDQLLNDALINQSQLSEITKVRIYKSMDSVTPGAQIEEIDAKDSVGQWITIYEDPNGTSTDYYQISFLNANNQESSRTLLATGGFLSRQHEMLDDVRFRLHDFNPELYRLDVQQYQWSTTQLWRYLNMGLNKFNQTGPMLTNCTMEAVPATELVKDWAVYFALKAKGILENFNNFQYSDGVSLTWNRHQALFQTSDGQYNNLVKETRDYKLAWRPRARFIGTQRLPFRVLRPLSFLPNMKNVFGI